MNEKQIIRAIQNYFGDTSRSPLKLAVSKTVTDGEQQKPEPTIMVTDDLCNYPTGSLRGTIHD